MPSDPWVHDRGDVLLDDDGAWWHVSDRLEAVDTDARMYRLSDATHTADQLLHAEDVEGVPLTDPMYRAAGWSADTKPAAENGFRVNGVLCGPTSVDYWRGRVCASDHECPCGAGPSDDSVHVDVIVNHAGGDAIAAWLDCWECARRTYIHRNGRVSD